MIARIQYITQDNNMGLSHADLATRACKGGIRWVQVRIKSGDKSILADSASEVKNICDTYNAKLIINDHVEIAREIHADGVHLGAEDMQIEIARTIVGDNCLIGGSANTLEDVIRLHKAGADYIGLGPYSHTATKENLSPVLGLKSIGNILSAYREFLRTDNQTEQKPIIAIGGITIKDVSLLMEIGIHGVAVASAINMAENIEHAANNFVQVINKKPLSHV